MQTGNIHTINVDLGKRSYPIHIGTGTIEVLPDALRVLGAKGAVAIASDDNVAPLYAERVAACVREAGGTPHVCTMPAGEAHKRMAQIDHYIGEFLKAGMDRSGVIIALGGGVVGDVVGYAAASFMRGVRFIQIPTTIVAQVDSSVGGKTAVNHEFAKNLIGALYTPPLVVIYTRFLGTLPHRELRSGFAEVIKHALIQVSTPDGDRGGNSFKIAPIDGWGNRPIENLHAFWDFGAGSFLGSSRPLSGDANRDLQNRANNLRTKTYPRSHFKDVKVHDPMKWAEEGFAMRTHLYALKQNEVVPESYRTWAKGVSNERVTLAGYRLADQPVVSRAGGRFSVL